MIPHPQVPAGRSRHACRRLGSLLLGLALTGAPLGAMHALAAPSPPAIVQAQGLSDTVVEVMWTAVAGATSYDVYRGATHVGVAVTSTLFDDGGRTANTTYTYTLTATVGGTPSAPSSAASATTQAPHDAQAPTTPGTITASALTSSSVKLSWGGSSDNQRVEGYRILRSPAGQSSPLLDIDTTDAITSYTAKALQAGKAYTFGVQAIDTEDNASPIRTISITTAASTNTTAPSAPSSLTLRVFSSSRIDMYWSASSSSDVSGYQILRGGIVVGQVNLPARLYYSDNGLAALTKYTYTVKAIDSAGNVSAASPLHTATTLSTGAVMVARGPYLQSVSGTSSRVVWWTNIPTQSVVWYGAGTLTASVTDPTLTLQHVMLIGPLSPGTLYSYTVGDGTFATGSANFQTAAAPGTPFTFAALGDFGGNSPGETQNGGLIAGDASQFIQTLGDNIYPEAADPNFATTYSDYDGRLFKQFGTAMKSKPFWAADGNKEYYGHRAWWQHMSLPNNERWYSYDWGDAHILVLDGEMPFTTGTPQYLFAQADLAAHQSAAWRIVVLQRPPYSSSSASSSSIPVQTFLVPLFQQQNVQLVLNGNSHNYERTFPLTNGVPTAGGVTYIVSGNGGNGFNTFSGTPPSWSAYRQSSYYGYLRISVNSSSLTVNEIRADTGATIDSTTISGTAPPPPPAPTNLGATPGDTQVSLSWTASSGATGYNVYRSTTPGTEAAPALNGNIPVSSTTFTNTGLSNGTTYWYVVRAVTGSSSESANSNEVSATPVTPPPPPAPTNLGATPGDAPGRLGWAASTSGQRATTCTARPSTGRAGLDRNVPVGSTTYTNTGLSNGTTYWYVVRAVTGSSSESANSNEVSVTPVASTRTFVFSDGFESGSLSAWSTFGGLTIDGTRTHTGAFAAHASVTPAYAKRVLPTTYADGYFRTYFYIASGYSTQVNIIRYRTSADGSLGYLYVTAAGLLGMRNDVGAVTTATTTSVSSNAWHSLEIHLTVAGTASATQVWLDGVQVSALSFGAQNWGTTNIGKVQIGEVASARTYDLTFDDVVFDSQRVGP